MMEINDYLIKYDINKLNDYCILQIINFLDVKSKLKLHLTCKRLNRLILRWFNRQKAFGDVNYSQINLCTNNDHKLDEYQLSLESVTKGSTKNDWSLNILFLNRIFQLSNNVECLHFNCLDDENSINEKLITTILSQLPKLTCLSFGIGLQISSNCWNSIINQLGNQLKHLQINRVNYLTLENIVKKCPNLISLYIRFCPSSIGCISYLWPKLRRLKITSMATIYIRNALFIDRNRNLNNLENEDDEQTINLAIDDMNGNMIEANRPALRIVNQNNNENENNNLNLIAEIFLNHLNSVWYLNLTELRLNRITCKSLTVIFNHCISLQVLDLVLFFNRQSIVFENQDFIQLSHRLPNMRLFSLDIFTKWNLIHLDNGISTMLQEWPKLQCLIIKKGLITEELFKRIKTSCKDLKVISIEFCDVVPYNHRLNEITDKVVDSLIELPKLTKLRLHFTGLTDKGIIKLVENCKNLKYLDLFGCLKVTNLSLKSISNKLNTTNRCEIVKNNNKKIKLSSNLDKKQSKSYGSIKYNLRERKSDSEFIKSNSSLESIDTNRSLETIDLDEPIDLLICNQFDTITASCVNCNKKPQIFYLSLNRTKINLKTIKFKIPNTLFILKEDNPIWNCSNYQSL